MLHEICLSGNNANRYGIPDIVRRAPKRDLCSMKTAPRKTGGPKNKETR